MEILYEITQTPTEGKLFEVKPLEIDRSFFQKKRKDKNQDKIRHIIKEAFAELDRYHEKYASPFYTLIPEKTWDGFLVNTSILNKYANNLGGYMADWVEQALEWAQRICNGESWEAVCNEPDTANWYRVVVWKNGYCVNIGGSRKAQDNSTISSARICDERICICGLIHSVPLVVIRK